MKTEFKEHDILISLETREDAENWEKWRAEALELVPKLFKLFEEGVSVFNPEEFEKKRRAENLWIAPSIAQMVETAPGQIALITKKKSKATRRELDGKQTQLKMFRRTLVFIKLLCFVPYEEVLKQEKTWREHNYMGELTDRCNVASVKQARYKAIRNADMCVSRAKKDLVEFFKKHPEHVVGWSMLYNFSRIHRTSN